MRTTKCKSRHKSSLRTEWVEMQKPLGITGTRLEEPKACRELQVGGPGHVAGIAQHTS
jgi:hypothetical protein